VKLKQFAETQKGQKQTTTSSRQYQLTLFDVQLWEKRSLETRQKIGRRDTTSVALSCKYPCHAYLILLPSICFLFERIYK